LLGSFKTGFNGSYGTILNIAVPFVIKWIIDKKEAVILFVIIMKKYYSSVSESSS
jgi:hypothetical protein